MPGMRSSRFLFPPYPLLPLILGLTLWYHPHAFAGHAGRSFGYETCIRMPCATTDRMHARVFRGDHPCSTWLGCSCWAADDIPCSPVCLGCAHAGFTPKWPTTRGVERCARTWCSLIALLPRSSSGRPEGQGSKSPMAHQRDADSLPFYSSAPSKLSELSGGSITQLPTGLTLETRAPQCAHPQILIGEREHSVAGVRMVLFFFSESREKSE